MPSSSDRRLVAGLAVLALIAQTFASGRLALAPAVFAAPFFALQVIERTRSRVGVACVFVVQWIAFVVQWRGYILAPPPVYVAVSLGYSILGLLPYLAHVALAKGRPPRLEHSGVSIGARADRDDDSLVEPLRQLGSDGVRTAGRRCHRSARGLLRAQ